MATYSESASLGYSSTEATFTGSGSVTTTQSGTGAILNVQAVGTTYEALALGDISSLGALLITNDDATNYVEVDSSSSFTSFPQKIRPGKSVLLAPQTTTLYVKANTASCNITVTAVQL